MLKRIPYILWYHFLWSIAFACPLHADEPKLWRTHDDKRPDPEVVTPAPQNLPLAPPSDAIILFNGASLAEWEGTDGQSTRWIIVDGALLPTPDSGPTQTKKAFGSVQLHVEWMSPTPPVGQGQGRGNSGVYLMSKYEVQVLDSFESKTYADGQAGAIYGQSPPLVNASLPPGEWQSFDIVFHRPQFDENDTLTRPAMMTVFHNAVLVQAHFPLWGPTNWLKHDAYKKHDDRLPLILQDHGNPVRFRNIWLRELPDDRFYAGPGAVEPKVELDAEYLGKLTGSFRHDSTSYRVRLRNDNLQLGFMGRFFDLVPISETSFAFRTANAGVDFTLNADGEATAIVVDIMGDMRTAVRE